MKRQCMMAMVACLAIGSLIGLVPSAAQAQAAPSACFPPAANGDYPPTGPFIEAGLVLNLNGFLLPGHTDGFLNVDGGQPGQTYCGTLFSAPVTLNPVLAGASGSVAFSGFKIPNDFKVNANHHLDVFRDQHLVGAYDFCVTTAGHLVAVGSASCLATTNATVVSGSNNTVTGTGAATGTKGAGSLPHTGWDHLIQVLKAAALALGLGAFFMYLRRRRAAQVL